MPLKGKSSYNTSLESSHFWGGQRFGSSLSLWNAHLKICILLHDWASDCFHLLLSPDCILNWNDIIDFRTLTLERGYQLQSQLRGKEDQLWSILECASTLKCKRSNPGWRLHFRFFFMYFLKMTKDKNFPVYFLKNLSFLLIFGFLNYWLH